ncbi:hypothetical protein AeNC1_010413 [Aphanomyces euteiches]|nr:hypothetical protein AeNC1_010413 [Aphanomyces euteiches]
MTEGTHKYFRHEHVVGDVEVTEAFATKLHENPILTLFLGDQSTVGATAVGDHATIAGRNYITFVELDVSPLLGGDLVVEQQWGSEAPAKDRHLPLGVPIVPCHGIRSLVVRVKVEQPILSPSLVKELNPITFSLRKVSNLPGITVQAKPLLQFITPTPHVALHKCCMPAYASFRLPLLPNRVVRTGGILQDTMVVWNYRTTFLSSHFDRVKLRELLSSGAVEVEVHDRDIKLDQKYIDLVKKWESTIGKPIEGAHDPHTNGHAHGNAVAKMDVFHVDEIAKQDIQALFVGAGDGNPHGLASFRLYELITMSSAQHLQSPSGSNKPFAQLAFTADVVQRKRRKPPKEGSDEEINLSQLEKLVRQPGAYLNCLTALSIDVTLQHALKDDKTHGAFSRMVVVMPYNDVATLQCISKAIETVNSQTLPGAPLRSYQLTAAQKQACDLGELNLITGFQVIDANFRMIFLEGLATSGMTTVTNLVPRTTANSTTTGFRMFSNPDIRFSQRLYTAFDVDLKRIKLRDPLPDIIKRPELYMRSKVSENCFQALNRLSDVRKANRLVELLDLDLFPTVAMLLEVESKYGESITLQDIHGSEHHAAKQQVLRQLQAPLTDDQTDKSQNTQMTSPTKTNERRLRHTMPETDSTNTQFEFAKKNWKPKDYLDIRRQERQAADETYAQSKAMLPPIPDGPVYIYSGQKLRTKELEKDKMRERLAKDKDATFTYSTEFNSLTMSMVDETKLALLAEQASKAQWTTPGGFVYPAPRQPSEFYKHKDAPSAARCEDLHAPWIENLYHPQPLSRGDGGNEDSHKVSFDSLPSKDMVFGGTNADGSVNPEYFKSVHLVGDGLAKEMEEAKAKEHKEWLEKIVVDHDNLRFIAHGDIMGQGRARPSALDKPQDILAGTVRSKPLRIVRNAKLPSGKQVPLHAMPVSIMNQDEYKGGAKQMIERDRDPSQFVARTNQGDPKDFFFPSITQILVPNVNKHTTLLKPRKPLAESEKTGLRWKNPSHEPRQQTTMEEQGQVVQLTQEEHAAHMAQMEQQLKVFWAGQLAEMEKLEVGSEQDFKNHNDLPLARIKRIMKSDEDVRMISAEAPVLFAKACEMFILELTLRSWGYSEKNKRRTLQKEDIQTAIRNTDIFDFLVDVIN